MDSANETREGDLYLTTLREYLEKEHPADIQRILLAEDPSLCYSITIHMLELIDMCPPLAQAIYDAPRVVIPIIDQAIIWAQEAMLATNFNHQQRPAAVKHRVHARLLTHGSGMDCPQTQPSIGNLRVNDEGRLITVRGTVIRAGSVQMMEGIRWFECSKCKHRFTVAPQVESRMAVESPSRCASRNASPCQGRKFTLLEGSTVCCDYQELRIQEPLQALGIGSVPRSISVILEDDLVDSVQAGDDVMVTGVLACRWKNPQPETRCDLEHVIHANNIWSRTEKKGALELTREVIQQFEEYWKEHKDDPLGGRNGILEQICPQVYGLFAVKLAVALALIGGVERVSESGSRIRGECHLLLVGDPGVGKSQFLKYAAKLSSRAVLTTGLGSTTAGLTVTAVKQEGQWMLEAGALVLADGGICCIDEFSSIREADKAAILEAMEQQTLSVAKAGLVTTLHTRATVFAVTNPKGQYDPDQSLAVNTAISGPLLSRFDMVLVLRDLPNPEWDQTVSHHILCEHLQQERKEEEEDPYVQFWTLAMLQSYIRYVKEAFMPVLRSEAEQVLVRYYQMQRRTAHDNAARTTIRMLESLIRLAQAHARFMFRNEVLLLDAMAAVICVESSMTTGSALLDRVANTLHAGFPEDPAAEYARQEQTILSKLGLQTDDPLPRQHAFASSTRITVERPDSTSQSENSRETGGLEERQSLGCQTMTAGRRNSKNRNDSSSVPQRGALGGSKRSREISEDR